MENWRPKQKMWCYISLAVVTCLGAQLDKFDAESVLAFEWIDYVKILVIPVFLQGLIAWRSSIDQSVARSELQKEQQPTEKKG
jgi:hypothetical protein